MNCEEARDLISPYQDGELTTDRQVEVAEHLKTCDECAAIYARDLRLSQAIRTQAPTYPIPESLRSKLLPAGNSNFNWRPFSVGALVGAALACLVVLAFFKRPASTTLTAELVSDHVRSLMANHLIDVESSDRHTVKPWFLGKVDFSPSVPDLASDGFPLLGGRLDYVSGHPATALVYRRNRHIINVLVLPHAQQQSTANEANGYNVLHWQIADLDYWAVSDVAEEDLQLFKTRFQAQTQSH